jgi:hypothetical protein
MFFFLNILNCLVEPECTDVLSIIWKYMIYHIIYFNVLMSVTSCVPARRDQISNISANPNLNLSSGSNNV